MLILVSISSVLTTVGQAWTKCAFAVTLLRPGIADSWHRWILWFIIVSLNSFMIVTFTLQWTNYCDETPYWWKISGMCVPYETISDIKTARNSKFSDLVQATIRMMNQKLMVYYRGSVQHHHRLRSGAIPMALNMEDENKARGEAWHLYYHEPRCRRCDHNGLANLVHVVS